MTKYKKKPVVIEAFKWNGEITLKEPLWIVNAVLEHNVWFDEDKKMVIKTLEGNHIANKGDYIIKGVQGELYPCKPDIFEQTYEEVIQE